MYNLKLGKVKFTLATGWHEVTYDQWMKTKSSKDFVEILAILTGLNKTFIKRQGGKFVLDISAYLNWMQKPFEPEQWTRPKAITFNNVVIDTNIDIRLKTFGQKIVSHNMMMKESEKKSYIECMPNIIATYIQPLVDKAKFDYERSQELINDVRDMKLCEVYPLAGFFFDQMRSIIETENRELNTMPTTEQARAGVDMFFQFGVNNTIDALAGGDALKYEQVLMLSYNTVFLKMKRTKIEAKFNRNYEKIMKSKAEAEQRARK